MSVYASTPIGVIYTLYETNRDFSIPLLNESHGSIDLLFVLLMFQSLVLNLVLDRSNLEDQKAKHTSPHSYPRPKTQSEEQPELSGYDQNTPKQTMKAYDRNFLVTMT